MLQLINFKNTKEIIEGFQVVNIFYDREVLADMPICLIEFGKEYKKPVLFNIVKGFPVAAEADEVIKYVNEKMRMFYLKKDENGKLIEVDEKDKELEFKLPIDTDVSQLEWDGKNLKKNVPIPSEK